LRRLAIGDNFYHLPDITEYIYKVFQFSSGRVFSLTFWEALLLMAVITLAVQLCLIQRHYDEKLADQAFVLNFLINKTVESEKPEHLEDIRDKLFNSSH
jgi:hypothetical protein